jgi:hypothetical protein
VLEEQIERRSLGDLDYTRPAPAGSKGRWMNNVFIERLRKSVNYKDFSLKAYDSTAEIKKGLAAYFTLCNEKRWHHNFDRKKSNYGLF